MITPPGRGRDRERSGQARGLGVGPAGGRGLVVRDGAVRRFVARGLLAEDVLAAAGEAVIAGEGVAGVRTGVVGTGKEGVGHRHAVPVPIRSRPTPLRRRWAALASAAVTTPREVGLLRLAAQRLAAPSGTAADVVRWLGAAQAQDYPGALASIALRTADGTRAGVEAALDAGEVVRSWPMRGTLHLVAAEDLPWMLSLTTERLVAGAASRRAALGLEPSHLERAREVAVAALSGGRRLTRDALVALWDEAGLLGVAQRSYHLLWHLAQTGVVCFGPVHGNEQLLVLLDEWVPPSGRRVFAEREEALGAWALRYATSHGPVTVKDLAGWTKLVMADVRAGLAVAAPQLERVEVDGVEHWMGAGTADALAACRARAEGVFLLPGFDEFLLGCTDRSAVLPAEHASRIVPGGNGMFLPTVVVGGQVAGTWKRMGSGSRRRVEVTPFTAFVPEVQRAVDELVATM